MYHLYSLRVPIYPLIAIYFLTVWVNENCLPTKTFRFVNLFDEPQCGVDPKEVAKLSILNRRLTLF